MTGLNGTEPKARRRLAAWVGGTALIAAGAVGGGVLASSVSASADTVAPSASSSTTSGTPARPGPGGSHPVRGDEQAVSSQTEAKLRAAALKAVPGGTVYRVESDAGDGAYEAHMTKADGTLVTVKFDKSLSVTKVEDGMGTGDPAPAGQGPGGGQSSAGGTTGG